MNRKNLIILRANLSPRNLSYTLEQAREIPITRLRDCIQQPES